MKQNNPIDKRLEETKKCHCRICESLGKRPAIGCVGDVFICSYPKNYDR